MIESGKVTEPEAWAFADLVAAHFNRNGRNPTDEECRAIVATARQMVREGQGLQ